MEITDLTEVWLLGGSEITSFDRTDLRAKHENTDLTRSPGPTAICGGGDTDATARLDYESYARVAGLDTSIIRTAVPVDRGLPGPDEQPLQPRCRQRRRSVRRRERGRDR